MKSVLKISIVISCIALSHKVYAQLHISNNTTVSIKQNETVVQVKGDFSNNGVFVNGGSFYVNGNIASNGTTGYNGGTLSLTGSAAQTINGTVPLLTTKLALNNVAGIILNTTLGVGEQAVFTNGIVTAASQTSPLELATGATVANASNNSHVNGYVRALGTGNVTYPVGSATGYKPVSANITANDQGLTAIYFEENGGSADYTTGYNNEMLTSSNIDQYWDIHPVTTASATVTLSYDDSYSTISSDEDYVSDLKVAHYQNGSWHSEGGNVSGDQTSGTVTSMNTISSWSPFTVGLIQQTPLPVKLLSFTAQKQATTALLKWATSSETDNAKFTIFRSGDGKTFVQTGEKQGVGTSATTNNYTFYDNAPLNGINYYQLVQVDNNGKTTDLGVRTVNFSLQTSDIRLYPNPTENQFTVSFEAGKFSQLELVDLNGRVLQQVIISSVENSKTISLVACPTGVYVVKISGKGIVESRKMVKR